MPTPAELAVNRAGDLRRQSGLTAGYAGMLWAQVDPDAIAASWATQVPAMAAAMTAAQFTAASTARTYVDTVTSAQGLTPMVAGMLVATALAGQSADGRDLRSLLYRPAVASLLGIRDRGLSAEQALRAGHGLLDTIVRTEVVDAGRSGEWIQATVHLEVDGYTRVLVPPSCSRCVILAGRWYRWNAGFRRHPRCDCVHLPGRIATVGDTTTDPKAYFDSLSPAEQDRIFTNAGAQAIRDGANINQVVNARRGMYVAGGRRLTRESTTRRGVYRGGGPRWMPEQIYRIARDRLEAIDLLRLYGYIL